MGIFLLMNPPKNFFNMPPKINPIGLGEKHYYTGNDLSLIHNQEPAGNSADLSSSYESPAFKVLFGLLTIIGVLMSFWMLHYKMSMAFATSSWGGRQYVADHYVEE